MESCALIGDKGEDSNKHLLTGEVSDEEWKWTELHSSGTVPTPRHCHSCVIYKDHMYIFGGYSNDASIGQGIHRNDFHQYDLSNLRSKDDKLTLKIEKHKWSTIRVKENVPSPRHSHTAVIYGDSMWLFGGITSGSQSLSDLFEFNFTTNTWREQVDKKNRNVPPERWGHSAVVWKKCMYIFGGFGNKFLSDLWQYNFETRLWTRMGSFGTIHPKPRQFHAATAYGGYMYIVGGFAVNENHADFLKFNFETQVWTAERPPPIALRGHTAVVHNDSVFVFGGFGPPQMNDIMQYNFKTGEWSTVDAEGKPPSVRHFHTATMNRGSMYVFAGFSNKHNMNDVYKFCIESMPNDETLNAQWDFKKLLNNEKFSDVTFIVEGRKFFAHKNILYCRSEHFAALIDNGMKESNQECIILSDISYQIFTAIMEYIYTNTVTITAEIGVDLFIASDLYLLKGLKNMVERFLIRGLSKDNVFALLQLAQQQNALKLQKRCLRFISKHKLEDLTKLTNGTK